MLNKIRVHNVHTAEDLFGALDSLMSEPRLCEAPLLILAAPESCIQRKLTPTTLYMYKKIVEAGENKCPLMN